MDDRPIDRPITVPPVSERRGEVVSDAVMATCWVPFVFMYTKKFFTPTNRWGWFPGLFAWGGAAMVQCFDQGLFHTL